MSFFTKAKKAEQPSLHSILAQALAQSAAAASAAAKPAKSMAQRVPMRWRVALMALLGVSSLAAAAIGVMLIYYTFSIPDPMAHRQTAQPPIVRILARDGSVLSERGAQPAYIPLELVPRRVSDAVLATEDRRFWSHWGLDPFGLIRAGLTNLRSGRFAEGGSTLTQQLAKNMFLSPERTLSRKVAELSLAIWLELRLSKEDILELYLNRVYFGGGATGIEAASQRYFEKSVSELTIAEAAIIAGVLKAPSKYAPTSSPDQALERGRSVLSKMRAAGVISDEEETRARAEVVRFSDGRRAAVKAGAGYAIDYVMETLPQTLTKAGDIVVETTLDAELQRRTSAILAREVEKQGAVLAVGQSAAVVLDTDGGVRAIAGGRSYAESQYNRALKSLRQPGSAMKPFVYLTALEKGYTPESQVYDLPLDVAGWAPKNDNGKYQGPLTMGQALAQSVNTVSVRLLMDVGASRVAETARRLGIKSELRKDASLALGTSEVNMLELTGAYVAFANGGKPVEPYVIRRIRQSSGRVLFTREAPATGASISKDNVRHMNTMLRNVVLTGTGKRARLDGRPAAGKTGTSQDFRDAWFVGYTGTLVAAVWAGNDDGRPTGRVTGGSFPALIWKDIMSAAHEGRPVVALPGLENVVDDMPLAAMTTAQAKGPVARSWLPSRIVSAAPAAQPGTPPSASNSGAGRGMPPAGMAARGSVPAAPPMGSSVASAAVQPLLDAGTLEARDRSLAAPASSAPASTADGRIIVRPGQGLMSLGGPQ